MQRILAIVPGDTNAQLLFFPTLEDLKRTYPHAEIDVAAEPRAIDAYRICKFVNQLIRFDFSGANSLADWGNFLGQVRDRDYDALLVANQTQGIGLPLWLTGIPVRVGYAEGKATNFLTRKVSLKTNQYGAAIYHDLLQGFDIHSPCPQLTVNLPASDLAWADAECKRLGIEASGYVLIFGNGYPTNQWQPIIQDFQTRQPHVPIVLLQDESNCEEIAALQQICSNLGVTKPPDIGKLAATIAAASLILTVEGIPVQLAIAVQTYSVVLIGTTNPQQLLPINDKFIGICSETGNIANIQPDKILTTVWQN